MTEKTMDKIFGIILIFMASLIVIIPIITVNYLSHFYRMNGEIIDSYTIVDSRGEAWEISDTLPLRDGTKVLITFNDNKTKNFKDDIIVEIKLK